MFSLSLCWSIGSSCKSHCVFLVVMMMEFDKEFILTNAFIPERNQTDAIGAAMSLSDDIL